MNKLLKVDGLNCANCANKIEIKLKDIPWIENVNLNFTMGNLSLKVTDTSKYSLPFLQKLVDDIEEGVALFDKDNETNTKTINKELIKLLVSLPLFITGLVLTGYPTLRIILFVMSYSVAGYNVLFRALKNIIKGQFFDEFFLMSIATIGAFIIGEFAEGVGVMIFFQLGEFIQGLAVGKSKKSIQTLMSIKPDFVRRESGEIIQPEEIKPGEIIEVRPGEKIPVDGEILYGETTLDTKTITGESVPRSANTNDLVLSGFVNISHVIKIKVTNSFEDSTVSKILEMVQNETSNKTVTENFITKFSRIYTPLVVFTALIIATVSPLIFSSWTYNQSIYKALIFLVISCPCALVISVPLGYFGGIGRASKAGILIKGSTHLEALTNVTKFAFDKTGTLTMGQFSVKDISTNDGIDSKILLEAAYKTECKSNHPIAKAIITYTGIKDFQDPTLYNEVSGKGIIAEYNNDKYIAGKKEYLIELGIIINSSNEQRGTQVYFAHNNKYLGVITLSDTVKIDAHKLTPYIGKENILMLTGDNRESALITGNELGITNIKDSLLPIDKANIIKQLNKNERVMFVGDGINDAPVLTAAYVGISMGGIGSDAAIEASDIVLMTDEPSKIIDAIKIAKFTRKIIIQNITIALGLKIVIMFLGLAGFAGLWLAIFADVGVGLLAVLNSIRTLNYKID